MWSIYYTYSEEDIKSVLQVQVGICDCYNGVTSICKHVIIFYFIYYKNKRLFNTSFFNSHQQYIEEEEVILNVLLK